MIKSTSTKIIQAIEKMTELKTLKDLEKERNEEAFNCNQCFGRIRAEAVKHIKHETNSDAENHLNNWIKHFFNLTEEDLEND